MYANKLKSKIMLVLGYLLIFLLLFVLDSYLRLLAWLNLLLIIFEASSEFGSICVI